MGRTIAQLEVGELAQCNRFIAWWLTEVGEDLRVVRRPNPPDFILESSSRRTWLEVTDVFFDDEDVDWQLSSNVATRGILESTDDKFVARFAHGLANKLSKPSYSDSYTTLGPGILLLTARYYLIDEHLLHSLQSALRAIPFEHDHGFFGKAYLEGYLAGRWQYGLVYPRVELIEETQL